MAFGVCELLPAVGELVHLNAVRMHIVSIMPLNIHVEFMAVSFIRCAILADRLLYRLH